MHTDKDEFDADTGMLGVHEWLKLKLKNGRALDDRTWDEMPRGRDPRSEMLAAPYHATKPGVWKQCP